MSDVVFAEVNRILTGSSIALGLVALVVLSVAWRFSTLGICDRCRPCSVQPAG